MTGSPEKTKTLAKVATRKLDLGILNQHTLARILRLVIGIGLAYGLIHVTLKSTGGDIWKEILQAQKPVLLLALLSYGAFIGIPIYRWNLLLRVQEISLRVWGLIRATMIGVFFNLVIPGPVSGDIVKMIYAAKQTKEKKTEVVLTILLDRAIGMFGLFTFAGVLVLLYLPFLLSLGQEYRSIQIAALAVGLMSIFSVFGIFVLMFRRAFMRYSYIDRIIKYGAQKLPQSVVSTVNRLVSALELYRGNLKTIGFAIVISWLIHLCVATSLFLVGLSVGEDALRLSDYLLATLISNVVAIIPVTPGGIGLRDLGAAMILRALNAPTEKAGIIPVIMTLIIIFWRLIGGVFFISYKTHESTEKTAETVSDEGAFVRRLTVK